MKHIVLAVCVAGALLASPLVAEAQLPIGVRVRLAPPAPRIEVRGIAPSPRHVWMGGHWRWEGGRHAWFPGRWELGRPGSVWIDAHCANQGGEWVFEAGHWQSQGAPVYAQPAPVYAQPAPVYAQPEIVVQAAPPPPQVEVIPVAPSPQHFWIAGHWGWEGGRHMWMPGRYEMRRPGRQWEPAHWGQGPGGYRYQPGHWR